MFDLLLKSAAGALLTLGRDPKWFGASAQLGVTTVLHTWARDLHFHPHAHCIVTGGGLAPDGKTWVAAPPDFLLPVHVLGALFRGKFLAGLARWRASGLPADDHDDRAARRPRARLYDQSWVVYAKRPFGGAEQVYRYLGRYTHRVAIGNSRLVSVDDDAVVFRTRGQDVVALHPLEFIRRFLAHRLPRGFVKIRHGGLLAPTNVNDRLASAKAALASNDRRDSNVEPTDHVRTDAKIADLPWTDLLLALAGVDLEVPRLSRPRRRARPADDGVPRPTGRSVAQLINAPFTRPPNTCERPLGGSSCLGPARRRLFARRRACRQRSGLAQARRTTIGHRRCPSSLPRTGGCAP